MSHYQLRKALDWFVEEQIGNMMTDFGLLNIIFNNMRTETADAKAPYIETHYLPGPVTSIDLQRVTRVYSGVYQLTVKTPANQGSQAAFKIGDAIAAIWDKYTRIPTEDPAFFIEFTQPPQQATGLVHDYGFDLPITIYWTARKAVDPTTQEHYRNPNGLEAE